MSRVKKKSGNSSRNKNKGEATMQAYGILPNNAIYPLKIERAERTLAYCREELELPDVYIKWFLPEDEKPDGVEFTSSFESGDISGLYDPGKPDQILIRADLQIDETCQTVAHETFHAFQHLTGNYKNVPAHELHDFFENGAVGYAENILDRVDFKNTSQFVNHLMGKDYSSGKRWEKKDGARRCIDPDKAKQALRNVGRQLIDACRAAARAAEDPGASMAEVMRLERERQGWLVRFDAVLSVYEASCRG